MLARRSDGDAAAAKFSLSPAGTSTTVKHVS